jgi:hypothetical protein
VLHLFRYWDELFKLSQERRGEERGEERGEMARLLLIIVLIYFSLSFFFSFVFKMTFTAANWWVPQTFPVTATGFGTTQIIANSSSVTSPNTILVYNCKDTILFSLI